MARFPTGIPTPSRRRLFRAALAASLAGAGAGGRVLAAGGDAPNPSRLSVFDLRTEAEAALPGLPEGQGVEILADEALGGLRGRYRVEDGALRLKVRYDAAAPELPDFAALSSLDAEVAPVGGLVRSGALGASYRRAPDDAEDAHLDYSAAGGCKWYVEPVLGQMNIRHFGAVARGSKGDDTAAFRAALRLPFVVVVPPGWYSLRAPMTIARGSCLGLRGTAGPKATNIIYEPTPEDRSADRYMFDVDPGEELRSGFVMENLHLLGTRDQEMSCLRVRNSGQVRLINLDISRFRGHGLAIDKMQDSVVEHVSVQDCGRSTGDGTVNAETTHAPLEIYSTIKNDGPNMVRFLNCEIEQNYVSPFIRIRRGIALMFAHMHSEIRNEKEFGSKDLFDIESADVSILDCNNSRFRNGLVHRGYGVVQISGGRGIGNIRTEGTAGRSFSLLVSDTAVGGFDNSAGRGDRCSFSAVRFFGPVKVEAPDGQRAFTSCTFEKGFSCTGNAQAPGDLTISGGRVAGKLEITTDRWKVFGLTCDGDASARIPNGAWIGCSVAGKSSITASDPAAK